MSSLRAQLTFALLCAVLGLAGICGWGLYAWARHTLSSRFDAALVSKAKALGALVQWDGNQLEVSPVEGLMPEFGQVPRPQYFLIRRGDGSIVVRSPSLHGKDLQANSATDAAILEDRVLPDGRPGRQVVIRFRPAIEDEADKGTAESLIRREPPEPLTLVLAQDRSELIQLLGSLRWSLVGAGFALAIGILIAVTLVVRWQLRPLDHLAQQVRRIDASSLSVRIAENAIPAELVPVRDRLNELLSRLQDAFDREKRFTSDAAHELRTPIAELWSLAEIGLAGDRSASSRELLTDAMAIARQMDGIVTSLLALARAKDGRPKFAAHPIDLNAVVKKTWSPLAPQALARKLAVVWEMPSVAEARADQQLLAFVVRNLLCNAVDHTPLRGDLLIATHANGRVVELAITNTNSTLTPADLPQLGQAFWRKDESRTDQTHHGLGLSLALAYSKMMRLDLRFELPEPRQFRAVLSLPIGENAE